jgi:type III restriction enzyme
MELKEYQQRVLDTFDVYLEELVAQHGRSLQVEELSRKNPDLKLDAPDFSAKTWVALKSRKDRVLPEVRDAWNYSPRKDGTGRSVPNICFKVPTGGGKTLLAAASVSRIFGRFLRSNQGFVLWITPNEAIYSQTKRLLTNREHPYRQMLDLAAAGKVKILEKDGPLSKRDVDSNLCVMLLMLQAANRQSKETLKVFRDRGNVHGFFPNEADGEAHRKFLLTVPNLDSYSDAQSFWPVVKDSLGNVLRSTRPVVIIDEGHKAYSLGATETLYGFNPCFVLELSATPNDRPKQNIHSNWLVDVRGTDLDREEMIKLPINVKVKGGDDWQGCVQDSVAQLNTLQKLAEKLNAQSARYIRPILLVQVERTGKEHREAGFVHANDVKDYLLRIGFRDEEIAFKTSQVNELKTADLLSPTCPIRAIITKQALQEGWDCPFAYVLCSLSATRSLNAMTQLVGRILRQPDASRVGVPYGPLNECYIFCHHASTKEIVDAIKTGLEKDGMGDLAVQIRESIDAGSGKNGKRTIKRRETFAKTEIYLPVVNYVDGETVRPLDYEQDVIFHLDWEAIRIEELAQRMSPEAHTHPTQVTKITFTDAKGELIKAEEAETMMEEAVFDPVYSTRVITDIVPNPWLARDLVLQLTNKLTARGFTKPKFGELGSYILEELRNHLLKERDRLAEQRFLVDVAAEKIQFRLRADRNNWAMPSFVESELPEGSPLQYRDDGKLVQKSIFSPVYRGDFNSEEAEFACYIDEEKALAWWHRNVARAGYYFVQGWRKNKVYPDFIFALQRNNGKERLIALETKGDQLAGNLDTTYKKTLLERLTKAYRQDDVVKAGELQLVSKGKEVVCDLVLMSEAKTEFHKRYIEAEDAAIPAPQEGTKE